MTLDYGSYGIFLIMGNASTVFFLGGNLLGGFFLGRRVAARSKD